MIDESNIMADEWRPIPFKADSNRYLASNFGEICDLNTGKILHKTMSPRGYYYVSISKHVIPCGTATVHRLIAFTFLAEDWSEEKNQVNHKNGIKTDNRVQNLEWVSPSENVRHAYANNLIEPSWGENNIHASIKIEQVRQICETLVMFKGNVTKTIEYLWENGSHVSRQIVSQIKTKRSWVRISDEYFTAEEIQHRIHFTEEEVHLICKKLLEHHGRCVDVYNELKDIIPCISYQRVVQIKNKKSSKDIADQYF